MPHSLIKIWIHGVFGTKERLPLIKESFEGQLHQFMVDQLEKDLKCRYVKINGTPNHIHILFLLNPEFAISQIFKQLKGSSSHWINQNNFLNTKFSWQVGYGAFSISESMKEKVTLYVNIQKEHHKKQTFEQEYQLFLDKYSIVV